MVNNLVIDIGNSRTKAAVFQQGALLERFVWEVCSKERISAVLANHSVQNVILSVVGPAPDETLKPWLAEQVSTVLELDHRTRLPFRNAYATPHTLGKDRLAAVAGAWARFAGQNCLVIDAGTCITYDVLTAEGIYVGGNISPGIRMRFKAMHAFTASLPLVEASEVAQLIGQSTETAMRYGVMWGTLWEMEGMIAATQHQWPHLNVLLTGGDRVYFEKNLKTRIFAHADLVLEGLNTILEYHVQHS